jgi:hypothetical protein
LQALNQQAFCSSTGVETMNTPRMQQSFAENVCLGTLFFLNKCRDASPMALLHCNMYLSHDKKQVDSSFLFPHGLCEIILLAEN